MSRIKLEIIKILDELDFFLQSNDEKNVKERNDKK